MQAIKVLHIIQWHCLGGAARGMIATAKYSAQLSNIQHRIVSLKEAVPKATELAHQAGISVISAPDGETLKSELENADIVHVHFWNNPQMYEFLKSELPPMRLLMWFHVAGDCPPQVITKELVHLADVAIPCNPYSYQLPVFKTLPAEAKFHKVSMVYDAADFERVAGIVSKPHDTFNVGYIGALNSSKMHPRYIQMSAAVDIPNIQFIVCGGGGNNIQFLKQQAQTLGAEQKFDFRGFVEDIKSVIETFDVYGYPLCEDTYAAAELNLQEVMYAGVPPVVFPYGGVKQLVIHNYTGFLVHSEAEYKEAIEYLYHHPEERKRLGNNAREYARQIFGAENAAKALNPIYKRLLDQPKCKREWGIPRETSLLDEPISLVDILNSSQSLSGAEQFIQSLGDTAPQFSTSFYFNNFQEVLKADLEISNSSTLLYGGEGGLFQYKNYYQEDGYLNLWSGLVLQRLGQHFQAIASFQAALNFGCDRWRVAWYLAQSAYQINELELAEQALQSVLQFIPDLQEARQMLQELETRAANELRQNLSLRSNNLIVFPDWKQPENWLYEHLGNLIYKLATSTDKEEIALLVDASNISEEDANLIISGIAMNLLMEEELDVEAGPNISVLPKVGKLYWRALHSQLRARILLDYEDKEAIASVGAETLPTLDLATLENQPFVQTEDGNWKFE
jgi:glycosyltransferase involved in cell wall biosynthesis